MKKKYLKNNSINILFFILFLYTCNRTLLHYFTNVIAKKYYFGF